jgi:hypothetical protein
MLPAKPAAVLRAFVQPRLQDQFGFGQFAAQPFGQWRGLFLFFSHTPSTGGFAACLPPQAGGARYSAN